MTYVTMKDGTEIFYKDWGKGPPVIFSHGWPLDADAWDAQMMFLLQRGYRVIAHDRRAHGRSTQAGDGHDMDTYSDDLATLMDFLDIEDATLVGHATGGGEVARYIGRHGTRRVSKVILIGAVPPLMLKTDANPGGTPMEVFDGIRRNITTNRARFFKELAVVFYGYNRPNVKASQGLIDTFSAIAMRGAILGEYECIRAFSETDFTHDLKRFDVPTFFIHGDDDQIVPISDSALIGSKLVKNSIVKVYPGASHGLCATMPDHVSSDIFAFMAD